MQKMRIVLSLVLLTALAGICRADKGVDMVEENAQLKQRVDKLEKELAELKKMVMQQAQSQQAAKPVEPAAPPSAVKPVESDIAAKQLTDSDVQKIMAMLDKEGKKKPVWSEVDVQLYGRLKFDAAFDTSRTEVGNYVKWVNSESSNDNDSEFNMTANESRFGVKISGPENDGIVTSGRAEVDFFEGGSENKSRLMMRHAYMNLEWPGQRFSILAGQTSDVISPLFPYTMNYSVGWWAGNIGYRRPQIRLTKSYAIGRDVDLTLEGALSRTIGTSGNFTPGDAGEDAGIPGFQGRASVQFPWLKYKPTTVGVSGHWAKEEYDTDATGTNDKYKSWSLNLDMLQPINEWLAIKGELFTGENLSAYLGGIGQGVNTAADREVASTGGWVAASLTPCPKWNFNFGVSADDPKNEDVTGMTDAREYNRSIFGNAIYSLNKNAEVGFELSQWRTRYAGAGDADAIRAQTSFIYKF